MAGGKQSGLGLEPIPYERGRALVHIPEHVTYVRQLIYRNVARMLRKRKDQTTDVK